MGGVETSYLIKSKDNRPFSAKLRTDVIGPSNPNQTESHHLRHLAIENAIPWQKNIKIAGETRPIMDNLIHCSDSQASAIREVKIWFADHPELIARYEEKVNNGEEFVLIILKPEAMNNQRIKMQIMDTLARKGKIGCIKEGHKTSECEAANHYQEAVNKPYGPPIIKYISKKKLDIFTLEKVD